jgi:hypothetical protein
MKKFMYWSKSYLLPLCFLLFFGLMSCEEQEIIPLAEEDANLVDNNGIDVESYDFIVSEKGEITGRYNREIEMIDEKGNVLSNGNGLSNSRDNHTSRPKIFLYKDSQFRGSRLGLFSSGNNIEVSNLSSYGFNDNISSIVVPSGCYITAWQHANFGGKQYYATVLNVNRPHYEKYVGSTMNDKISSFKVRCRSDINTSGTFCGYAWSNTNYGGNSLPLFAEKHLNLSSLGWFNNKISSVSTNYYSTCDAIGLWEHTNITSSNKNQKRTLLDSHRDYSNIHGYGMGDRASVVETDREISSNEVNGANLMRLLDEVKEKRSWGKAFTCSAMSTVCVQHGSLLVGLTAVMGRAVCGLIVGSGVVEGIAEGAALVGTGGADAAIVAPLAAFTTWQITKGVACFGAIGAVLISESAACDATMETYCDANLDTNDSDGIDDGNGL